MAVDTRVERGYSNPTTVDTLNVPGARLYYEVRGSGPVLLMIPGGPSDAGGFGGIAGLLADRYTVVTYDPRGNSRSSVAGPPEDWRTEVHGDDAAHLLAAVSQEPAFVFGNSGGAQVGLDLAARYPKKVRTLVAHEPPATELLPDAAQHHALSQEVYDTYRRDGAGPAMAKFLAGAGLEGPLPNAARPEGEPSPEMLEMMARMGRNVERFLAHNVRQISGYVPDVATLRAGSTRIVAAVGDASRGQLAHQCGVALAERLGTPAVYFPGGHGVPTPPDAFAETLHELLNAR